MHGRRRAAAEAEHVVHGMPAGPDLEDARNDRWLRARSPRRQQACFTAVLISALLLLINLWSGMPLGRNAVVARAPLSSLAAIRRAPAKDTYSYSAAATIEWDQIGTYARRWQPDAHAAFPRILHQSWVDRNVPDHLADNVATWRELQPSWGYRFHTDADNAALVGTHYGWLSAAYEKLNHIQKADVARLLYMHRWGGVYADLDVRLLQPLAPLLAACEANGTGAVIGQEPLAHAVLLESKPRQACNAVLASAPGLDLCTRLRVLNLAANELEGLPDMSAMAELLHVGVGYNRVDDHGLGALVRCLPRAKLQSLDLGSNELTDLEAALDALEPLTALRHLTLQGNPLCIRPDYRATCARHPLSARLAQLDGTELPSASEGPAGGASPAKSPAPPDPPPAATGAEGEGDEAAAVVPVPPDHVKLVIGVSQLHGVPDPANAAEAPAAAPAPAPPAGKGAPEAAPEAREEHVIVRFSVLGETRSTAPVPRSEAAAGAPLDERFELVLPRSVRLRDQLSVHGIDFSVIVLPPPPEEAPPPPPE